MDARLPDHYSSLHWHRELSRIQLRKIRTPRVLNLFSGSHVGDIVLVRRGLRDPPDGTVFAKNEGADKLL